MSDTPITDALASDPRIEKRDVPARVWREMARMERDRAELKATLRTLVALDDGDKPGFWPYAAEFDAAAALLARLEKE